VTPLSLFALTNNPVARIVRFPLSSSVQADVQKAFYDQEDAFKQNIANRVDFDGKYKPERDECLVIKDYDDIDDLSRAITNPLSAPEINPTPEAFTTIRALFSGYFSQSGTPIILLQAFDQRKVLSTAGTSLFYSLDVYKKVDGIGLTLDVKLSAMISDGSIQFFSFHIVRQIFDLTQYYAEATDNDLDAFASLPSLQIADKAQFKSVADTWIRRKVSLVTQGQILQQVPIADIKIAAAVFNINLKTAVDSSGNEIIVVPSEKAEIKKLMRFLDEDYYQSILLRQIYVSNSRRLV